MDKLTTAEVKKIELDMLAYIHKVCVENNIRYWVCGGTLIGAIRHNGFIPWDDDIDIDMPRPDFERFKKIADSSRYMLLTAENEKYYYASAKLVDNNTVLNENNFEGNIDGLGVFVDIFPLDGLPSDAKKQRIEYRKRKLIANRIKMFYRNGSDMRDGLLRYLVRYARWIYDKNKNSVHNLQELLLKTELEFSYDECEFVFSLGGRYGYKEIYPRRFFEKTELHKFEDIEVNIPSGYDEFLTQMYGDYMKLPPEEKQVSNHDFDAFWKDDIK